MNQEMNEVEKGKDVKMSKNVEERKNLVEMSLIIIDNVKMH